MLSKTFFSTVALAFAAAAPAVRAQLIDLPLPISLDLGTTATCPADAPPGTDVDATVLAVVTLDTVVGLGVDLLGLGLVGAEVSLDVDVCLCLDGTVDIPLITLPVNLEAPLIADITSVLGDLDLDINIPLIGGLDDLLANPLLSVDLSTTGQSVAPCICPEGATATCSDATCSCICPPGFFFNPVTNECLLAPSNLARVKRSRAFVDPRQAKRAEIEARLQKAMK